MKSAPSLRVLVVEDRAEDAELSVRELKRAELDCETRCVDTADYFLKTNLIRLGPAVRAALALAKSQADKQIAEAALRVSERRFRALVEESWDAVALFTADGTIVYGSPATRSEEHTSEL